MTINIIVDFDIDPSQLSSARKAFRELARATKTEPGALTFDVFVDPAVPNGVVLVEEWADQGAIDDHMKLPHTAAFLDSVDGAFAADPVVRRLDAL